MLSSSMTLAYFGTTEILIVAGIVVLIFGGAKIPQLAKGLGEGIREFRNATDDNGEASASATKA